jgi:hypothetical protein
MISLVSSVWILLQSGERRSVRLQAAVGEYKLRPAQVKGLGHGLGQGR